MSYHNHIPGAERPLQIEMIRASRRGRITPAKAGNHSPAYEPHDHFSPDEAFICKPAADWLAEAPPYEATEMLFGSLWRKGELCIIFADTNAGKSVLAVQIGDAVSRGLPLGGMAVSRQYDPVLYFDFELSAAQFVSRYHAPGYGAYEFAPNFHRLTLNPDASRQGKFANYHDYIINAFENMLVMSGARTIIIDNITCLRTGTQNAAGAIQLMQSLQRIKERYGLSMMVLAHTPKRDAAKAITANHLQGSKMLLNFADSAFAIGESQTRPGTCYLKQIKQRTGERAFPPGKVLLCTITKPANFLQFEFGKLTSEAAHLQNRTTPQQKALERRVAHLRANRRSINDIARETGLSRSSVYRVLKGLGMIEE